MSQDVVSIASDHGMVVLFDPELHRHRIKAASSWWRDAPFALPEREDGRLALWLLHAGKASGRAFRFRVGEALDAEREAPFVCGAADPVPLQLTGGELFLGPVERLPGDGAGDRLPELPDQGSVLRWTPGRYTVTVHVLNWQREERFWNEDNEPTADAPPDFVVVLAPLEGEAPTPPAAPEALLGLLPRKTPTASSKVRFATRPRPVSQPDKPARRGRRSSGATRTPKPKKPAPPPLKPGELGVGATVRHPVHGIGTVTFMRDGFPKAKVNFHSREYKVDKAELKVV